MRSSVTARSAPLLLALALSGCTASDLPAGTAPLDPIAFFAGRSEGTATLDPIIGGSVPVRVESSGSRTQAGGLTLIQRISEGRKPDRIRTWIMQPVGPGRYTGSLTDAKGPVAITVTGPRAVIRYVTPSGMKIRQQLALQQDGRTIHNRLEAYKYGIRLAVLTETIRKPLAK